MPTINTLTPEIIDDFITCPKMAAYRHVARQPPASRHANSLAARALKMALTQTPPGRDDPAGPAANLLLTEFERTKEEESAAGILINGEANLDDYQEMLHGYFNAPWNRGARILSAGTPYLFKIKPGRAVYQLSGLMQELIQVDKTVLAASFPQLTSWPEFSAPKPSVVIHRVITTARRNGVSPFELMQHNQLRIAALALAEKNNAFEQGEMIKIPDLHAVYYLRDHLPYRTDGPYLKNAVGEFLKCDMVTEPCVVGKHRLADDRAKVSRCRGKREYCRRMARGQGMYFTPHSNDWLRQARREIMAVGAAIRKGDFQRRPNRYCANHCGYKQTCFNEIWPAAGRGDYLQPEMPAPLDSISI
ncbi:MAG: PD-(D/E)XK nuclease family protein [Deltaproteobacteria bacterium]|nr:PD-(D/E)XK nuclease family protein [Deltaproteobacteria bacterium]